MAPLLQQQLGATPHSHQLSTNKSSAKSSANSQKSMTTSDELEIKMSEGCIGWMHNHRVSFAVSTYQIGKLLTIGHSSEGRFSVFERTFDRCMGMCTTQDGNGFYMSCKKSNLALRKYPQGGANGQWTRQSLYAAEQLNNRRL